ncbi:myb-like protein X [Vespula squamosa]|uniref:Myb-like protein X n=1 Tax=Vespula squamosa TaxID=30214 RepID=A0ABD2B9L3_VESSQ
MLVLKTNTTLLYKDLFEWWNEETGFIFRRIRKSAALARGYNRWSSERLSEDRLTMQAERGSNWNFSSNKRHLILESILFVKRGCKVFNESRTSCLFWIESSTRPVLSSQGRIT